MFSLTPRESPRFEESDTSPIKSVPDKVTLEIRKADAESFLVQLMHGKEDDVGTITSKQKIHSFSSNFS